MSFYRLKVPGLHRTTAVLRCARDDAQFDYAAGFSTPRLI